MELNYTKMRLNIICSSLHTDLLNLGTSQIRVVSVARSGNTRNWMWNHVIFWLYNWGCHLTFQTLLGCRCEGSPPWASSEYVLRDFCTSPTSVHGSSTSGLGELVWWKSTQGGLLVPSSASVQLPRWLKSLNFRGLRTALPDGDCHLCITNKELWLHQYDIIFGISLKTV